jgi:hypothetical protein
MERLEAAGDAAKGAPGCVQLLRPAFILFTEGDHRLYEQELWAVKLALAA